MDIIRSLFGKTQLWHRLAYARHPQKRYQSQPIGFFSRFFGSEVIYSSNDFSAFKKLLRKSRLEPQGEKAFFYSIDEKIVFLSDGGLVCNVCPNYGTLLSTSLANLLTDASKNVSPQYSSWRRPIEEYLERMAALSTPQAAASIRGFYSRSANSLFDALQRILIANSLLWQMGNRLCGLGRLDQWLFPYFHSDLLRGVSLEELRNQLRSFLLTLHGHFDFKSSELRGDTGQIIILGGTTAKGDFAGNELTLEILNALKELHLPDPKAMLRVNSKMPDFYWHAAVQCFATGIGSPIFANDDVIVPALTRAGDSLADAKNYAVSACWEPFVCGSSASSNNFYDLNYSSCLNDAVELCLKNHSESVASILASFKLTIEARLRGLNSGLYRADPFQSLFFDDCLLQGNLLRDGGARYYDFGVLTTGLSNAVNGLINIENRCFSPGSQLSLFDFNQERLHNFQSEDLSLQGPDRFAVANERALFFTNALLNITEEVVSSLRVGLYKNSRVFFGLSSPNYLKNGQTEPASFDGRKKGAPLGVHISSSSPLPPTELLRFVSQISLPCHCINGNVTDVFLSSGTVIGHEDQMVSFCKGGLADRFFEMQFNVCDYSTLVDAKAHPEKHVDLIVRVWGFSAYFNDLPLEYKDLLIERAKNDDPSPRV